MSSSPKSTTDTMPRDEFPLDEFEEYLTGISGGDKDESTAAVIMRDMRFYFDNSGSSSSMESNSYRQIMNHQNLEAFYQLMNHQLRYKPSTIAEKLHRLRRAIQFIVDQNFGNAEVAQEGLQYRELLSSCINSLSKQISLQRHERGIKMENEIVHTTNPKHFLKSEEVKLKLSYAKENISKGVYNTN